jgi:hypothetical protein
MDNKIWYCRHPQCTLYGRMAPYAPLQLRGWHRHAARLRCQVGPGLVSARTGTAYAGIRPDATTYPTRGQKGPWKKWQPVPPTIAAEMTDHGSTAVAFPQCQ